MKPLDTQVFGDIASCRETSKWLDDLANGVGDTSTSINRARSSSEACWGGQAAENFRTELSSNGKSADELEQIARKAGKALTTFADQMDTVDSRMRQAREVAGGAGLTVTATHIQPPGPGPGAAPQAPQGRVPAAESRQHSEDMAAHSAAVGQHQELVRAYEEASTAVADARRKEDEAHEQLTTATDGFTSPLEYLTSTGGWTAAATVASAVGSLHGAALMFRDKAATHTQTANRLHQIADNPAHTPAQRAQARVGALRHTARGNVASTRAASNSSKLGGLNETKYGKPVFDQFTKHPGQGLAGSNSALARGASSVLKKVPYVGAGITAWSAGSSIANGADKSKTILSTATNYAAGAAVTAGTIAVIGAGGWAVLGAVGAGAVASAGVGWVVENTGVGDFFRDVF